MNNSSTQKRSLGLGLALTAALAFGFPVAAAESWSVTSPSGRVKVTVELADLGGTGDYPKGPALYYRIELGPEGGRVDVLKASPLGVQVGQEYNFMGGIVSGSATPPKLIEEAYVVPHGKRRECHNRANQITLALRTRMVNQSLEMDFRAYDDGVAFRYRLPESSKGRYPLDAEATGFALPPDARLWVHPSDKASVYSPAYETYYENEISAAAPALHGVGWAFPMLFRTADSRHWGLITEANVQPNFCGSRLTSPATNGVFRLRLPTTQEGNHQGAIIPSSVLPWEMPWRVIILGDSLATIVESTLVEDVCPPTQLKDTSWIKPGRVAWSWWSDPPSPTDGAKQKKFVDFAAEMGWEYLLVDANWTIMDNGTIHDVLRHAKSKGVGVLLWYNSGGPHNVVTEKPRDSLTYKEVRRFEFDLLKKWGVKGVKVDFFQSDKQDVIGLYHGIMQDAADFQIMVNFHGCTLPRGWSRTYPHLMSMEAVRGEECYIFDPKFPELAPVQNTITPFTRNVVGPMDYTPVAFTMHNNPHRTTSAHELALCVLFESGWVHFADKPEAYLSLPDAPKAFLKKVPVAWDDTRLVAGYPGKFVVLARRQGATWYLAGVNGQNQAREERLQFGPWLGGGKYDLTLIGDGANARSFGSQSQTVTAGQGVTVKMLPYGGFSGTLKPVK